MLSGCSIDHDLEEEDLDSHPDSSIPLLGCPFSKLDYKWAVHIGEIERYICLKESGLWQNVRITSSGRRSLLFDEG